MVALDTRHMDWSKSFMYRLHEAYFLIEKRLTQCLDDAGEITFSQFLILVPLHCKGKLSQSEIATFLHLTEATVSRHITGLVNAKLLQRKEDKTNRRKYILTITAKGGKAFDRAQHLIDTELKKIFAVIPQTQRADLAHIFDLVLKEFN